MEHPPAPRPPERPELAHPSHSARRRAPPPRRGGRKLEAPPLRRRGALLAPPPRLPGRDRDGAPGELARRPLHPPLQDPPPGAPRGGAPGPHRIAAAERGAPSGDRLAAARLLRVAAGDHLDRRDDQRLQLHGWDRRDRRRAGARRRTRLGLSRDPRLGPVGRRARPLRRGRVRGVPLLQLGPRPDLPGGRRERASRIPLRGPPLHRRGGIPGPADAALGRRRRVGLALRLRHRDHAGPSLAPRGECR